MAVCFIWTSRFETFFNFSKFFCNFRNWKDYYFNWIN